MNAILSSDDGVIVGLARQYLNSLLQTEAISTVILETN